MNFLIATNEPLGADKNSLDWWKAKKEEYPTLARLAMKNLCVSWKIFFCEHWTLAFASHHVDIRCKLTPLYLALWSKYRKGYNWRLIEYSHLVLGTRSAVKFEQVPSTSIHPLHSTQTFWARAVLPPALMVLFIIIIFNHFFRGGSIVGEWVDRSLFLIRNTTSTVT